jgi:hypothetical protein
MRFEPLAEEEEAARCDPRRDRSAAGISSRTVQNLFGYAFPRMMYAMFHVPPVAYRVRRIDSADIVPDPLD